MFESSINNKYYRYIMTIPLPDLSTLMNFLMNSYYVYSFGGLKHASVLATTSIADGALSSYYKINRNYVSLISFWGYIAYNAVKEISPFIDTSYKKPLSALSLLVSAGMVCHGTDIFAKKIDHKKALDSIKLTASFFDDKGIIEKAEQKFSEGYKSGIKYTAQNFTSLISNKFVLYTLLHNVTDVSTLLLRQVFFPQLLPQGTSLALFAASKKDKSWSYLIQHVKNKFVSYLLDFVSNQITSKLTMSIAKDLEIEVVKLALQDKNTQAVMNLGGKVRQLPYDIAFINNKATSAISLLFEKVLFSIILKSNTNQNSGQATSLMEALKSYSSMILMNGFSNTVFDQSNVKRITEFINSKFYKGVDKSDKTEIQEVESPEGYIYDNIQEIAKLGGNKFMLNKLLTYLENKNIKSSGNNLNSFLNLLKSLIEDFAYTGLFKMHKIDQAKLISIEASLTKLMTILNLQRDNFDVSKMEAIKSTIETLRKMQNIGPSRLQSNDMTLSLENYHLVNKAEAKDVYFIEKMKFCPGFVYAVTGKNGTGKTTFLSDIAKVMAPSFRSSGTIYYPTSDGKAIEEIFCGSIPFAPPATTLLEKLTYRIPSEYVKANKSLLEDAILQLFKKFEQKGFTIEKLNTKGSKAGLELSPGQAKIIMLMSVILYKQYLKKPTLLILDETLAQIDSGNVKLVFSAIKEQFKDSIVISVDHHARQNEDLYNKYINLDDYTPKSHEVEVMG